MIRKRILNALYGAVGKPDATLAIAFRKNQRLLNENEHMMEFIRLIATASQSCEWRLCHKPTERRVNGVKGVYCSALCAALAIVFRDTGIMYEMKEVQHGES